MEWQPIETAPKDGTEILAHWKPMNEEGRDEFGVVVFLDGEWWDPSDDDLLSRAPDFWMPIPAPLGAPSNWQPPRHTH